MLHENPILPRALITTHSRPRSPLDTYNNALKSAGVCAQIEMIKITPATLGREEMAWLWTALKADYRPDVSVSGLGRADAQRQPIGLLAARADAQIVVQAGLLAAALAVQPPNDQSAAVVGDTVSITGASLSGASLICCSSIRSVNVSLPVRACIRSLTDTLLHLPGS